MINANFLRLIANGRLNELGESSDLCAVRVMISWLRYVTFIL